MGFWEFPFGVWGGGVSPIPGIGEDWGLENLGGKEKGQTKNHPVRGGFLELIGIRPPRS